MRYLFVVVLLVVTGNIAVIAQTIDAAQGRQVFTTRCAACHAINKEVVGPALRDIDKRHTEQWIINFVHSSQTVIRSGDAAAVALFRSHNNIVMPDHPDLKDDQIRSVVAFIKEQSSNAPSPAGAGNMSFVKPYHGRNGMLDRIVYLNIPESHFPIRPDSVFSWFLIGMIVVLLVSVLYLGVYTNQVRDRYYKNSGDGNQIS